MLPKINNKSFLEISEEDLFALIDNEAYRENEYIDYKQNFAFLEITDKKKRNDKISEFKSDVCAMANAEGGYLIYGISDKNGCADEIIGVDIPDGNTDRFELDRRNNLSSISPRTPYIKFNFIKLVNDNYVVIIFVKHDSFAPYIHLENEKNYLIYKRSGNGKRAIGYQELKNMFNQSLSLEKEIYNYRMDRINYYKNQEDDENNTYSQFLILHIIPETFTDSNYDQNMYVLEKSLNFSSVFASFSCNTDSIPCVDGLRFLSNSTYEPQSECYIFNNGIVECFFPIGHHLNKFRSEYPNGYIAWKYIWDKICQTIHKYDEVLSSTQNEDRVFVCVSIIGCKGVRSTGKDEEFNYDYVGEIDRNTMLCNPVIINDISSENEEKLLLKKLYIEYLLAIGNKTDKTLNTFIKEVYHA